ncbi:extracellular solute-binding protein [Streptomyces sp. NPDC004134]|uniref:extracellular solute-binding protein n=1 Tax=Streptomyces sp. NPDC004134 TaxID=3364691 RepID=UPI00368D3AA8
MLRTSRLRRVLVAGVATAVLAGCVGGQPPVDEAVDRPVTVLGPWTGTQAKTFEDLLRSQGFDYVYQGTAAQREVLLSQAQAGTPPDIVIMPGPGELAEYAAEGRLEPLDGRGLYPREQYHAPWIPRATGKSGERVYWVPVRAALKSIVWYRAANGRPETVGAREWCVGMGDDGAAGWPGSDWIEDLLLQTAGPRTYARWARGELEWTAEPVVRAWTAWGTLMKSEGTGPARWALLNDYRGADGKDGLLFGGRVETDERCVAEHQGSFARDLYGDAAGRADYLPSTPFLPDTTAARGREVSGDFAALFDDRAKALEVFRFLASLKGQRAWADFSESPVYSANSERGTPRSADAVTRRIVRDLEDTALPRCLDASDVMPPAVRDAFWNAALQYLAADGLDPLPWLRNIQKVQEFEERRPWMTGICG